MKINQMYAIGIFGILALPLLHLSPYFSPADWGKTIIFRIIITIFLFLLTYQVFQKSKESTFLPLNLKNNVILWLLGALWFFLALSTIFSVNPYFSFFGNPIRSGGLLSLSFYFLFCIFMLAYSNRKDWKIYLDFSILVGMLVSFIAIGQYYSLFTKNVAILTVRPDSTIGNPIFLGIYLMMLFFLAVIFLTQSLIKTDWKKLWHQDYVAYRLFYTFAILLFSYTILITASRAAYLGILIGIIYFLLFFPKKLRILKITTLIGLFVVIGIIYYANTANHFPQFLEKNKVFTSIQPRLSLKLITQDERFPAWHFGWQAFLQKPLTGWGLENYASGFNKYYDSNLVANPWWDKAHNIFLELATTGGIPTVLCYLLLFIVLIYKLYKTRKQNDPEKTIIAHGLQTIFIAYLTANSFSIDSFSSYLLLFLLIAFAINLIYSNETKIPLKNIARYKKTALGTVFILLAIFLWQYNLVPLKINAQINQAQSYLNGKKCDRAIAIMDNLLKSRSFLNDYVRLRYIDFIGVCANLDASNKIIYLDKGIAVQKESIAREPLYVRSWIFLGQFTAIKAENETNPTSKIALFTDAYHYLDQATQLSPNNINILFEKWRVDLFSKDYQKMKMRGDECIEKFPKSGQCYWLRALAEIRLKKFNEAKQDIQSAYDNNFNYNNEISLTQLIQAYLDVEHYPEVINTYQKLIAINTLIPDYHEELAVVYARAGQYQNARKEAEIVLQLVPEKKKEVEMFLKTLP